MFRNLNFVRYICRPIALASNFWAGSRVFAYWCLRLKNGQQGVYYLAADDVEVILALCVYTCYTYCK